MIILRYAHAFANGGGGVEQHLEHLDRALLERNAWTIIRILLSNQESPLHEECTPIGRGRLVRMFVPVRGSDVPEILRQDNQSETNAWLREHLRDWLLCNPVLWRLWGRRYVLRRPIPRRIGEPDDIYSIVSDLISRHGVNLVMLHFQGGADAEDVIRAAQAHGVPFAVENHFANDRFRHLAMRKHALLADGVAGVSGVQVPRYLAGRFVNLSNGIDTVFFSRRNVSIPANGGPPVLLLPARIVRNKGHLDLIGAARELARNTILFEVHFAGREEPGQFADLLRAAIRTAGLESRVRFLGVLNQVRLREAYAAASVVALPTYHHEGLPRVLVEAQAMGLPVVAYNNGGVAEAMQPRQTGFLVRPGDTVGLAARLRELLENPALRGTIGRAGRSFVEKRFSLSALAARHEIFYRRILEPDHK
jgi:glycosyltransferase involved in cell wall biosynthesis